MFGFMGFWVLVLNLHKSTILCWFNSTPLFAFVYCFWPFRKKIWVSLFLFGVWLCGFLSFWVFGVKICIKLLSCAAPLFASVYCFWSFRSSFWVNLFLFGVWVYGFLRFGVKICIKPISYANSTQPPLRFCVLFLTF